MFGFNTWELLIFMAIILLLFGSSRLPTLMRNMGKSMTEFKKGMREEASDPDRIDSEKSDSEKIEK